MLDVAAHRARRLEGVVDVEQIRVHRILAGDANADPELLERRDVRQIPGQRAHEVIVDAVDVGLGDRLDEPESPFPGLREQVLHDEPVQRLDPSEGRCFEMQLEHWVWSGTTA